MIVKDADDIEKSYGKPAIEPTQLCEIKKWLLPT